MTFRQPLSFNPASLQVGPLPSAPLQEAHLNLHQSEVDAECEAARAELVKYGFPQNHKAHIVIALDISRSMENPNLFYTKGKIAKLLRKAMAMAIELSPNKDHSIDIFPFGEFVWGPITITEKNLENAIQIVWEVAHDYSNGTNYNIVTKAIRQKYTGSSDEPTGIVKRDDPIFCIFVTDGEPADDISLTKKQFKWSEDNAIFFKFIALNGQQTFYKKDSKAIPFETLKQICNPKAKKIKLLNKDLVILDDPDDLTLEHLFKGYRAWAEDAHTHGIIPDPEFTFNKKNIHDSAERKLLKSFKKSHGHHTDEVSHGHANDSDDDDDDDDDHENEARRRSGYGSPVIFGIVGGILLPVLLPSLPFWLMVATGVAVGLVSNFISNSIYNYICLPTTDDADHDESLSDDNDSDDDHGNNRSGPSIQQQLNIQPSLSAMPVPVVSYQSYTGVQYPLVNTGFQQQDIPSHAPPPYPGPR
jgi:hypothetical protein